ncbi:FAD-dependent oxidoreductase [uncultured Paludibaculum sp.]|uniref:FAD-dependent oxidoreductase n=1 Tax=uncultured Paludibaculum sp. TaxID=1765020 RepID=UPI002AAB557B|nr:FAD-dependent oxidoreductase [uncultured Paludibaculum sp.]
MIVHQPFHYHSLDELRDDIARLGAQVPVSDDVSVLAQPLDCGRFVLPNRLVVLPMEGCDGLADGSPDELTLRRYRRFAAGGSGLLWVEACAVVEEGRANPRQIWLHKGTVGTFRTMVEQAHAAARETMGANHRPAMVLQLTHSGRYSRPGRAPKPIIAHHSKFLDPIHKLPADYPLITDDELERLEDCYVEAARLALEAGFDAVDVKACHRYLISELHASHTRENSRYGGPEWENRTRFFRNIVGKIRAAVPGIAVTSRMNAYDSMAHPYGWGMAKDGSMQPDLRDPIRLVQFLKDSGAPLVNITIGNPYFNPYVNRPFDLPIVGMPVPPEHPLEGVSRFLHIVRHVQEQFPSLPVVGGGYSWLRQYLPNVGAAAIQQGWVSLVGGGRMSFAYPEFAREVVQGHKLDPEKGCVACSACTQIMRDGGRSGCVPRDAAVYEPIYKAGRAEALDTIQEMAKTCRQCSDPTCVPKCPAHVNVPGFIQAIVDGRFRDAYETIRANNVLATICGYVCPSETLCESTCINEHYADSVPIRHLQRWVSRKAIEEGWARETRPVLPDTGKRVAVVGAGPAGVAGAVTLASYGHRVTLLERADGAGGMAKDTIPSERMPDPILQRELEDVLASTGAVERRSYSLGPAGTLDDILDEGFDAVLLAPGLSRSLVLPGAERPRDGVWGALEFLRQVKHENLRVRGNVVVLGGGNTAIDAALSAKLAGASDVAILYRRSFAEMPAWPNERDEAMAGGVNFLILTQPVRYVADADGSLTGIEVVRTKLGEPDANGRRRPENMMGSEHVIAADLVVEAIGQGLDENLKAALPGVEFSRQGTIVTKAGSSATSRARVYAAGDVVNGGATVVQAVAEGTRAAQEIHGLLVPEPLVTIG